MSPTEQFIDLGDGLRIELPPIDIKPGKVLDMDALGPGIAPLWDALETLCVAGCCGIDAFDFSAEQLASARRKLDAAAIQQQLRQLQTELLQAHRPVMVSSRHNQYLERNAALQLIAHLLRHF